MNLGMFSPILESMYTDEMDIYHYTDTEDLDDPVEEVEPPADVDDELTTEVEEPIEEPEDPITDPEDPIEEVEDPITRITLPEEPDVANVRCRISTSRVESPQDKEVDEVPVRLVFKVFCSISVDIRAGDFVVVRKLSNAGNTLTTYEGIAGLPAFYDTHKEVLISLEESA